MGQRYIVALGSNQPHHRHGHPARVLSSALLALDRAGLKVLVASPVLASRPLGPSQRTYANGAALVECADGPEEVLDTLLEIERAFGRKRRQQRWGARVLDLDLVLWSGGAWAGPGLIVPHPEYRRRAFVLAPLCAIAPRWRDPLSGLTPRQLHARLTRPRALPKRQPSRRA